MKKCIIFLICRSHIIPAILLLIMTDAAELFAQQGTPLANKSIISLTVDENGKVVVPPGGFSLVEGYEYSFHITVQRPAKQHQELIKYFKEKLLGIYEKLSSPNDPVCKNYALLFPTASAFDAYKAEIKKLYDILDQPDVKMAETKLRGASPTDFPHFNTQVELLEYLFGDIFTASAEIAGNKAVTKVRYDSNAIIDIGPFKYSVDKADLQVSVDNMQNSFIISYYNKTRSKIAQFADTLKTRSFYDLSVQREIVLLSKYRKELLNSISPLDVKNIKFCTPEFINRYSFIKDHYPGNPLIKLIKTDWLLAWSWYTEGDLRLNPLNFTDADKLNLKTGYDTIRAKRYDEYINVSLDRMKAANSNLKISANQFDTLNRQSQKGAVLYNYDKENDDLKKKNTAEANKVLRVKTQTDSISFRIVDDLSKNSYYVKTYNAADALAPAKENNKSPIRLDTKVEVMSYNIKSTEVFTVTPEIKDTPDKSTAMIQLDQAADAASVLAVTAATTVPIFSGWINTFSSSSNLAKVIINQPAAGTAGARLVNEDNPGPFDLTFEILEQNGHIYYLVTADDGTVQLRIDVTDTLKKTIKQYHIDNCNSLAADIIAKVRQKFPNSKKTFSLTAENYKKKVDSDLKLISKEVEQIVNNEIRSYAKNLHDDLVTNYGAISVAEILYDNGAYIVPPKTLKSTSNPAAALYYNKYELIPAQETSKNITLPLLLSTKKDSKPIVKRTDSYKISSPHWITASMGVAHVFDRFSRSNVTVSNGMITNAPDEDQVRLIAGLNIYPKPILLTDSRFIGSLKDWDKLSRLSLFLGVSFPQPLYNPHIGISVEPWPGIKLTGGLHFYRRINYTVINDQLSEQHGQYIYNSAFAALTIDPGTFAKLIGLIK